LSFNLHHLLFVGFLLSPSIESHHSLSSSIPPTLVHVSTFFNDVFAEENILCMTESGDPHVPTRYILPPSQRPMLGPSIGTSTINLPVIDLSFLHDPLLRLCVIHEIELACR